MDEQARIKLDEFVEGCMLSWDSAKARRCRSQTYNDNKDKAKIVSKRVKVTRQETLEASSFSVLAKVKAKEKLVGHAGDSHAVQLASPLHPPPPPEEKDARDGEGQDEEVGAEKDARDSLRAGPPQRNSPPHKLKQASLAGYFNRSKAVAQEREETHKKDSAAARQQRKAKAATKPARAPPSEALREEARWLNNTDKQDASYNREGKLLVSSLSGRKRKIISSAST